MLRKSLFIVATLLLLMALFAAGAPQASAGKLAQATAMPMQMDMTATPMAMPMNMGDDAGHETLRWNTKIQSCRWRWMAPPCPMGWLCP